MVNFEKVSKARALFKERGAIRREYIRDEIAYSWVRSRLYSRKKVDFNEENTRVFVNEFEYSADEIVEFITKNVELDESNYSIFIVGEDGKLKNDTNINTKLGIKIPISFREEHIGTNGIGIAFSLKKSVIVYGSEHYSSEFDDFISASIIDIPFEIQKGVLGLIARKDIFDDAIIDEIKSINYSLLQKSEGEISLVEDKNDEIEVEIQEENYQEDKEISQENYGKESEIMESDNYFDIEMPYCLFGKSIEKIRFKSLVMTKATVSSLVNIRGGEGSGKEYLARYIHENSTRKNARFVRIDPRIDIDYVIDKEIEEFQSGTLYIEHMDELKKKSINKLQRIINCKLVNSEAEKASCGREVAFFISCNDNRVDKSINSILLTGLKLEIKSLISSEDDLQYLISKMIEDKLKATKGIINLEIFSPIYIHAKSKEILKEVLKASNLTHRTLDKILDDVMNITPKAIEVNQLKVEVSANRNRTDFKKLKEMELEYIREVMNYTGDNIAKASEILGIGRTTIYRKLKNDQ